MKPSDVGAIIAEVVQDYQRLGCELALLDPSFPPSNGVGIDIGIGSVTTSNSTNNEGNGVGDRDGNNGTTNATSNASNKQQQDKQQMSSSDTTNVGNDANKIKNTSGGHRERGRLNCLIMEFDLGLIGIASATSSTYIIALAETTTQHGLLKDKLTVLANLFQDSLETIC